MRSTSRAPAFGEAMIVAEVGQFSLSWTPEHGGIATDEDRQVQHDAVLSQPASTIKGFDVDNDEGGRIERPIVELQPGSQAHALGAIRRMGADIILITPEED